MLVSHLSAVEQSLLAISKIPANSGHSLHKGTPREAFVREFLEQHLPATVGVGAGEIIDARSAPNESRNQFDLIIYNRSFPKLHFGGEVHAFLAESVIATIEVKSTLTQPEFGKAAKAAKRTKELSRSFINYISSTDNSPAIRNYVVAYAGPTQMATVHGWVATEYSKLGIEQRELPIESAGRYESLCRPSPHYLLL